MSLESFDAAVVQAMRLLAHHPQAIFVGQSVRWDGARIFTTLDGVPMSKREEHPVVEDHQMGYCIGLAMVGKLPICIFPRIDFLLLAANQLVNHLDKIPEMWGIIPKVIIRTTVGRKKPLNAGPQHTNNHTTALRLMLRNINVYEPRREEDVLAVYKTALLSPLSTLIVENPYGD